MPAPPEPQVVQVVLPTGDVDLRHASIDQASGLLTLRQVSLKGSEVEFGEQVSIKLTNIGAATSKGEVVQLESASGRVLLEVHLETVELAKIWASALGSPPSTAPPVEDSEVTSKHRDMLRTLVEQQEEQLQLLETINQQKESQLLQMQHQLEESLTKLQEGQVTYASQQRILDEQKRVLESLVLEQKPVGVQLSPPAKHAGRAARPDMQVETQDVDDPDDEDEEGDEDEEQALLRKIRHFETEKAARETQLRDLHGMMAALGLSADQHSRG